MDDVTKLKRQIKMLRKKLKYQSSEKPARGPEGSMKVLKEAANKAASLKMQKPPKPEPAPANIPKIKKIGGRRMWSLWPGLGLIALAILVFIIYIKDPTNQIMALIFVAVVAGGIGLTWFGLKKREEGIYIKEPIRPGEKPLKGRANCLNIYYLKDNKGTIKNDRIVFEHLPDEELEKMREEHRLGKFQRCRDDGNYYFVHEQNPTDGKLYPFTLPDQVYFNPMELINVITMPASHRYAKPKATMMDKIKPALLLIGIGIMALLLIVTSGPPAPDNNQPTAARSISK
jgi:hypothetical protein